MKREKKIKIMQIIASLKRGGLEKFLYDLLQSSDKESFDINICCIGNSGIMKKYYEEIGSRVFLCTYNSPHIFSLIVKLRGLFGNEKIDIVHSHMGSFTFWVAIAARLARVPVIISTYHNTYQYKPFLQHLLYLRLSQPILTKQLAVSHAVQQWFKSNYGVYALAVLYLGIDAQKFSPSRSFNVIKLKNNLKIPKNATVIGTVGNCTTQKDQKTFLKMAKEIISTYPRPVSFLIVGDGILRKELMHFALTLGISDKVIFAGSRDDVPQLMALMDIFALTSRWEGLPITLLEAQAMELPIVASRINGIREAVIENKTALLAEVSNYQEFAQQVIRLLSDKQLSKNFGKNGRIHVLTLFTTASSVKKHLDLYNNLFYRKPPHV